MHRHIATLVAACMLMTAAPASAQFGRLVEPQQLMTLFSQACTSSAPSFAATIPPKAKARKWDELGRKPTARPGDRGWLVALSGLPAIVDISRPSAGGQTCSASSVSDPEQIISAFTRIIGRRPDTNTVAGGRRIRSWRASPKMPYPLQVISNDGQAMTRITITSKG